MVISPFLSDFYEGQEISEEQKRVARKTRKLVEDRIGGTRTFVN